MTEAMRKFAKANNGDFDAVIDAVPYGVAGYKLHAMDLNQHLFCPQIKTISVTRCYQPSGGVIAGMETSAALHLLMTMKVLLCLKSSTSRLIIRAGRCGYLRQLSGMETGQSS